MCVCNHCKCRKIIHKSIAFTNSVAFIRTTHHPRPESQIGPKVVPGDKQLIANTSNIFQFHVTLKSGYMKIGEIAIRRFNSFNNSPSPRRAVHTDINKITSVSAHIFENYIHVNNKPISQAKSDYV